MKHTIALIVLCGRVAFGAAPVSADSAYSAARRAYYAVKADPRQRGLRHHWLRVIARLETVAARHAASARAPEALFLAGQAAGELYSLSGKSEDRQRARASHEKLIGGWPRHRLADDALVALAPALRSDPAKLRRFLGVVRPHANDRQRELDSILSSLDDAPAEGPAERRGRVSVRSSDAPAKPVATAARRPRPPPARDAGGSSDAPSAGGSAVAEAIRKLVRPLGKLETLGPGSSAGAVPLHEQGVEPGGDAAPLEAIQERLRQVRVGDRPPAPPERVQAARLKALAKSPKQDLTLAQQLGLKVRRVVIDAGHGGHDTGAIGPSGTEEKAVALSIALKVADLLREKGLEVILTREDDSFVALEKRAALANEVGGDLFVSIHCNAAASASLRGVETYTLNTASSRYAVRLAARENAASERGVGDLRYVLADLATKANTQESQALAQRIQRSIVDSLAPTYPGLRDLGTKEALFLVLLGARMPAVLVETSFLSNPEEEKRLADDAYQDALAKAVASAVVGFVETRQVVAAVE